MHVTLASLVLLGFIRYNIDGFVILVQQCNKKKTCTPAGFSDGGCITLCMKIIKNV